MPWPARSRRRAELPPDWPALTTAVLERDQHTCRIAKADRCQHTATEVDHVGDRHDHSMANLRAACHRCHAWRTALQGHAARPTRRRPTEPHPGLTR